MDGFREERPFGWGLLLVGDGADQELPPLHPGVLVTATSRSIAVSVRHAQDVEPDSAVQVCHLRVEVRVGHPADRALSFDGVIEVPSGRISFGDADDVRELEVAPGRWRVSEWDIQSCIQLANSH
jgi:hypothetical protein